MPTFTVNQMVGPMKAGARVNGERHGEDVRGARLARGLAPGT